MAQDKDDADQNNSNSNVAESRRDNTKDHTPTKVVIRRLPPTLTPEEFLEQVSPIPEYDFFYFVRADMSLGQNAFTRAYINFLSSEDIFIFRDKFDGYVFLDSKGGEYPAVVEFAPFQKVPKKKSKKPDSKIGLIEQDADYKKFLESLSRPTEVQPVSLDAMVLEVENKENTLAKIGSSKVTTPLLEYLRKRREERRLNIAKHKEDRRRGGGRDRDTDRKRSAKEDTDKRKSASDKDGLRDRDRRRDRVRNRERDRKRTRDGPRLEKGKESKPVEKRWQKEVEIPPRHKVMLLRNTEREGHISERSQSGKSAAGERDRRDEGRERDRRDEGRERDRRDEGRERDRRDEGSEMNQESPSESEQGKGDQSREDRKMKCANKWREDERDVRPGGWEEGPGHGDVDFREKLSRDKGGGRSHRDEEVTRRNRNAEERGAGDRYPGRDRGGPVKGRHEKSGNGGGGGGGRDKYDRGGSERKVGSGDPRRKREVEVEKKRLDRAPERRSETSKGQGKEDEKKQREEGVTSDASKDDKDRQKDEEKSRRLVESTQSRPSRFKNETIGADFCDQAEYSLSQTGEENEERGGSIEGDDRRRKRKERPERQIYIPRKALEKQKHGSPQPGKGSDEKMPE